MGCGLTPLDAKRWDVAELPDLLPLEGDVGGQAALHSSGQSVKHNQLPVLKRQAEAAEQANL